jgi:hypothetical protein
MPQELVMLMISRFSRYPYRMAEEGGGGGGGEPKPDEPVEVVLQGGVKVKLPKAEADAYAAARTKDKAERDEMARKVGLSDGEKRAAEEKARRAEEDKSAFELAKKGEFDAARDVLTKQAKEAETKAKGDVDKLAVRYRDRALEAAIRNSPALLKFEDAAAQQTLVEDIRAQIQGTSRYDLETDALVIVGADGRPVLDEKTQKPVSADAFLAKWLEARPYYLSSKVSPGSGASGKAPQVIPQGAIKGTPADMASGKYDARDIASGKVVIVAE